MHHYVVCVGGRRVQKKGDRVPECMVGTFFEINVLRWWGLKKFGF